MTPQLTAQLDFHARALELRAHRQQVIASNIANADTPGYKAVDFDFPSALRAATAGSAAGAAAGPAAQVGQGIAGSLMRKSGEPSLRYTHPLQSNLDQNSVDMDRERAAFMDNALKYESTLRFVNANLRTALDAMKGPNQL
jgi:flagellar basal-body rod protein FlgB